MRILLTGSKGQVGRCFKDRLPEDWEVIAADSATLDITDAEAVANMVQNFQPDAIVNAAAYTAIDKAESEREKAYAVNATAVHNLAFAAHSVRARFVHLSTDYVFDGEGNAPYSEISSPEPQGVYGQSKLAGELLALAAHQDSLIIRTSWVFSEYGNNFVKTMLHLGKERQEISVVDDQIGSPTYAGHLAQVIITALSQAHFPRGIYHYSDQNAVSWYQFAQAIFQSASEQHGYAAPKLKAIATVDYPTPAPRPAYSVLDCNKIQSKLGVNIAEWQKGLDTVLSKLLAK